MFFKPRMVEVSELFNSADAATSPTTSTEFKNADSKRAVESIKAQARGDFKQMRINATAAATAAAAATTAPLKAAKGRRSR